MYLSFCSSYISVLTYSISHINVNVLQSYSSSLFQLILIFCVDKNFKSYCLYGQQKWNEDCRRRSCFCCCDYSWFNHTSAQVQESFIYFFPFFPFLFIFYFFFTFSFINVNCFFRYFCYYIYDYSKLFKSYWMMIVMIQKCSIRSFFIAFYYFFFISFCF